MKLPSVGIKPCSMFFVFVLFLLVSKMKAQEAEGILRSKEEVERDRMTPPSVSREDIVPKNITLPDKLLETGLYKQRCAKHKKCEVKSDITGKVATKYYSPGDSRADPHQCTTVVSCGWVIDCDGSLDDNETCYDIYKKEIVLGSNGASNCKAAHIAVDIQVDGAVSPEYECGVPDESDATQSEGDDRPT
ncbi:MAG: hypothetical protein SGBAC_006367 [Bacillariaceae sp.]